MTEAIQVEGLTKVFTTTKDHPPLRSVLTFMMAVVGLSLPEAIILRHVCSNRSCLSHFLWKPLPWRLSSLATFSIGSM